MVKACTVCNRFLNPSLFQGDTHKCFKCTVYTRYTNRQKEQVVKMLWYGMVKRVNTLANYRNVKLLCSRSDFTDWINRSDFDSVYLMWSNNNFSRRFAPSIDRIDPKGNYAFENMQVMAQWENSCKDTKGESHGMAKLTEEKVKIIRGLLNKSSSQLAEELGVSSANIRYVRRRDTWKHV